LLNRRIIKEFGTGYDTSSGPERKNLNNSTIEIVSRQKGSWMASLMRDWDDERDEACVRYIIFKGNNPADAIVKDENIVEQCIKFYAKAEFQNFKKQLLPALSFKND